ncbi:unnamed protein product [Parascedosporium putredinis]|uniref:Amine oxidase n=1 Tax=Parascedosporium putredinis TaxID=1442378 RepID=A0A9P1GYQ2_9PEZI|nr:unnamed protein product [Parascedosporium putredinis]CAI7990198.1 unnamed protein product [Parascedosporium putredinis]
MALGAAVAAWSVAAAPASGFDPLTDFEVIHKRNVWAPITSEDNLAVWNLLHAPESGLNLTLPGQAKLTDNYVFWIDTLHTNKSSVLPYLEATDTCGTPAPPKYARAIIFRGAIEEPDSQEFMIGPLPVSEATKIEKLDYIYNGGSGGSIPFNGRYFDSVRSAATEPLLLSVMAEVADITEKLIGGVYYGSRDNRTTLSSTAGTPMSYDGSTTYRTVMFRYPGTATYLTPLDFFVMLDCPGQNPDDFKLKGLVTNSRFFPTVADLRAAWDAGEITEEFQQTRDASWALLDYKPELGVRDLEDRMAPQTLEIGGKRYKLDEEQRYVEYMGWSFYLSFTRSLGVMLYDIKYKNESVIYELSLQEAAAQYAGRTPKAASTVYHDTYYSLGTDAGTLVEGFDCPFGSTMLPITYFSGNTSVTQPDAICIFEADLGIPISRHRSGSSNSKGFANLGTVKGTALTVRSIATIGNYDYMFDYQFHLEGSLEVSVRASGYLQSSFYYPDQNKWGSRVQVATQGSYHDHVLTYKADFDVAGTSNSLQVSELVIVNQTQPWFPELGEFEQMELSISTMKEEQQFNWPANGEAMYCIINENETNQWGEKRGYRIIPGKSNIHLTPMNSPFTRHQTAFAKSHLAVTVQHDNEPYANSVQNSVENSDIVLWFNLGMHHFTRAEDIPVTLYTEAVSSIVFAPQNFNDRAQDGDLLNRRWLTTDSETGEMNVETYGVAIPQCNINLPEPGAGVEDIIQV